MVVFLQCSKQCQRIFRRTGTCSSSSCYTVSMVPDTGPLHRRLPLHERALSNQAGWMGPPCSVYCYSCEPCWLQSLRAILQFITLLVDMQCFLSHIFCGFLVPPQVPFYIAMSKHVCLTCYGNGMGDVHQPVPFIRKFAFVAFSIAI